MGVGGVLLTTCVFFYRAALTSDVFIERDIHRVYYPLYRFWTERVRAGSFPQWYPYDGLGEPYISSLISGAFHPSKLLYLVLPLAVALKWNLLLAYAGALGGTYLLARRLELPRGPSMLAGLAFAFSGYLVSLSNNLLYVVAASTVPWVLWASLETFAHPRVRWAALSALLLASIALVGDPQTFAVCAGCVVLLALASLEHWRQRLAWAVGICAGGGLLSAVQILPSIAVKGESIYGERNDVIHATNFSGHPLRALEAVIGPIWLDARHEQLLSGQVSSSLNSFGGSAWTNSQHVGAVVLLLALLGFLANRSRRGFWLGGAFTLVLAWLWLGSYGGLYGLFHRFVPLWGSFRYPEKLSPFVLLPIAIGAGAGLACILADARWRKWAWISCGIAAAVLGLALGAECIWGLLSRQVVGRTFHLLPAEQIKDVSNNILRCGWVTFFAVLGAGVVLALARDEVISTGAILAVVLINSFFLNQALYWVTSPDVLTDKPGFVKIMEEREGTDGFGKYRLRSHVGPPARSRAHDVAAQDIIPLQQSTSLRPDIQALFGFETYEAYLPLPSARMRRGTVKNRYIEELLNTKYAIVSNAQVPELGLPPEDMLAHELGVVLAVMPDAIPRAYLARPRCVRGYDEAGELMNQRAFVFGKEAVVECGAEQPAPHVDSPLPADMGSVSMVEYVPERVRIKVDAVERSVLILSDAYYSGWTATVDGRDTVILPANRVVRAVWVDAGSHEVEFRYETPGLRLGLWLSGTALVLLLLGVLLEAWVVSSA